MSNVIEKAGLKKVWTINRFASDEAFKQGKPFSVSQFKHNIILNEGGTEIWNLITSQGSPAAFSNANARLAVGDAETPTAITGTNVTFTNGSATVTGTATSFDTQLAVGDIVRLDADDVFAEILSIESATSLTLTANYSGIGGTGAGSFIDAPVDTSTDLLGTNKTYVAMEATYPTVSTKSCTFRSVYGSAVGNHRWLEFSVANGASGTSVNMNRRLSEQGIKAAGQTWTLDFTISFA